MKLRQTNRKTNTMFLIREWKNETLRELNFESNEYFDQTSTKKQRQNTKQRHTTLRITHTLLSQFHGNVGITTNSAMAGANGHLAEIFIKKEFLGYEGKKIIAPHNESDYTIEYDNKKSVDVEIKSLGTDGVGANYNSDKKYNNQEMYFSIYNSQLDHIEIYKVFKSNTRELLPLLDLKARKNGGYDLKSNLQNKETIRNNGKLLQIIPMTVAQLGRFKKIII